MTVNESLLVVNDMAGRVNKVAHNGVILEHRHEGHRAKCTENGRQNSRRITSQPSYLRPLWIREALEAAEAQRLRHRAAVRAKGRERDDGVMRGHELRERRKQLGWTQTDLIAELGVRSRQTLVTWEQSAEDLPRYLELALLALERLPECRRLIGRRANAGERKSFERRAKRKNCTLSRPS